MYLHLFLLSFLTMTLSNVLYEHLVLNVLIITLNLYC